jgi:hypothetical protein
VERWVRGVGRAPRWAGGEQEKCLYFTWVARGSRRASPRVPPGARRRTRVRGVRRSRQRRVPVSSVRSAHVRATSWTREGT